ncbi:DUF3987 domain-containing protein [Flavobacteriaceae bacterium]|nr:DUF3987 domain-containing protein [Flavobacteriaceae bacterium]
MNVNVFSSVKDTTPTRASNVLTELNAIKDGTYKEQVVAYRNAKVSLSKEEADQIKKGLPAFTPSGTFQPTRKADNLYRYSGVVHADLDKLSADKLEEVKVILREDPFTLGYFISPSENGLKVFSRVDCTPDMHKQAISQYRLHIADLTGIYDEKQNDSSISDVSRLCFVSYDPDAYINEDSEVFVVEHEMLDPHPRQTKSHSIEMEGFEFPLTSAKECFEFTEARSGHQFVEGDRNNYIFHAACNCFNWAIGKQDVIDYATLNFSGQGGLSQSELQQTINSAFNNTNFGELKDKYDTASDSVTHSQGFPNFQSSNTMQLSVDNPLIPDSVYQKLPAILQDACSNYTDGRERDVFLLSAITAVSGCLNNVYMKHAKRKAYSNLCSVIIAPPASKKGTLKDARPFTSKIAFDEVSVAEDLGLIEAEDYEPRVWIGADSSAAALNGILKANDSRGVLWSTELKTLINSLKQDFGNYTSTLLKSFHNEPIEVNRRGSNGKSEQLILETPKFSILFSGVPEDLKWLIAGRDSGLTSRFLVYAFNDVSEWEDMFGDEDVEDLLEEPALKLAERVMAYSYDRTQFKFEGHQREIHRSVFTKLHKDNLANSDAVKRSGLAVAKIAMVLSAIRGMSSSNGLVYCHEDDFQAAITMVVEVFWVHFKNEIMKYGNAPMWTGENAVEYLKEHLAVEWTTQEYNRAAKKHKITLSVKQLDNHRRDALKRGVIEKVRQGVYKFVA